MTDMKRETAIRLLEEHITSPHIIPHCLSLEAIMRELAGHFEPGRVDAWGMAGLLHDLDYDLVDWRSDLSLHGFATVDILRKEGFGNEDIYHAILAHNAATGTEAVSPMDRVLHAADPTAGFITAMAKSTPDKKLQSVQASSIPKRLKDKRFAASANRESMLSIERLGMDFPTFGALALKAMQGISEELGL